MPDRPQKYVGIDVGAETVKIAVLTVDGTERRWTHRDLVEHHRQPGPHLMRVLLSLDWENVTGAAVTGRLSRQVELPRIPVKQAQAAGHRFLHADESATIVSIGSHGFSVLELRRTRAPRSSARTPAAPRARATSSASWSSAST